MGYLMLRRGRWAGRQILSERWLEQTLAPTPLRPVYGFLWWLNTDRQRYPSAPAGSYFALGSGGNTIWVEPSLDLVVVVRWIQPARLNEFIGKVMAAFTGT
jgi:CubicO group peptidase (beta-lactamase class C family)